MFGCCEDLRGFVKMKSGATAGSRRSVRFWRERPCPGVSHQWFFCEAAGGFVVHDSGTGNDDQ